MVLNDKKSIVYRNIREIKKFTDVFSNLVETKFLNDSSIDYIKKKDNDPNVPQARNIQDYW
jgi:hypothetical protein